MRQSVPTQPLFVATHGQQGGHGHSVPQGHLVEMNRLQVILTLHLLGDFRLVYRDTPVTMVDMPRLQSLLAYLVLHQGVPQARSHLAFLLWPDSTDAQAHTNLRNLLHKLRKALPSVDQLLRMDRNTVQWHSDASWRLDVLDFERAIARADQAEQEGDRLTLRQALEQAAQLYRGDLLPTCYDEWVLPERDRLCQLFLSVLERLLRLLELEGDHPGAIRTAQSLLRRDPLHEATYCHLMRLYAACGNWAAAVRTYQSCTEVLERELAVEPSAATQEAYEQLVLAEEARRAATRVPTQARTTSAPTGTTAGFQKPSPAAEAQKTYLSVEVQKCPGYAFPRRQAERRKWIVKAGQHCTLRRTNGVCYGVMALQKKEEARCTGERYSNTS